VKQLKQVKLMVQFYKNSQKALRDGASLIDIRAMPVITSLLKAKFEVTDEEVSKLDTMEQEMNDQFSKLGQREEVKVLV
jgi:V/A-type H+/Na+-transporting ATPase subunit A